MTLRSIAIAATLALVAASSLAAGAEPAAPDNSDAQSKEIPNLSKWYFFQGSVNNHPQLQRAARMADEQVNRPMRMIAPGFDDVETFQNQAEDFIIWTSMIGVGRLLTDRFDAFFQTGYSAGKVVTRATDPSLLLLPLHTDVEIKRSSFFAGLGSGFYPLGMPEVKKRDSFADRFKNGKPFIAANLNWNYMTFDAEVKAGPAPLGNLLKIKQSDKWDPWSVGVITGVEFPMTRRSTLTLDAAYNFFLDDAEDFNGPSFSIFWKTFLPSHATKQSDKN